MTDARSNARCWISRLGTALGSCALLLLPAVCPACGKSGADAPGASAPATEQIDPTLARMRQLKEAAQRVEAEREKRREELRAAGEATLTLKKLVGKKPKQRIELEFEFTNKSDKEMTMAEGTIVISDSAGKALRKLKVPFVDGVPPHKTATKRGTFPLDAASEEDHAFVKIPLKELKTEWIPSLYRYKDGTQQQGE
jgi:hypothetical protein